jgi:hypothetical protein
VVVKSGILIRDSTTVNSNAVGSVKFGEMVQILDDPGIKDTVNGMKGNWVKIKCNRYTGYVFAAYLGRFAKRDKSFPENYPQYFKLNASCGEEQYFNSDFYWYGLFDKGDEFKVSLVNLEFSVKSENWKDEMYDQYLKVSINSTEKPMFLIGLPDSIPNYALQKSEFMAGRSRQIYPGQHYNVNNLPASQDGSYHLAAYGNVEYSQSTEHFTPPFFAIKDYKITMAHFTGGVTNAKDILEDVQHPVVHESLPNILFIGDLNYDSVPDLILSYLTGHASANTYLFMSGYSDKEVLTKVGLNRWGACY